ncbi:MAG: hypothetical protein PVJ19_07985 [Desulfobacteraceae bacterium]
MDSWLIEELSEQSNGSELIHATSGSITYINSWNMQRVEINGVDYTNTWSNRMPDLIDGNYYLPGARLDEKLQR